MMSITETTVVAGIATFIFYGLVPVAIILYLGGARQRRLKRQMEDESRRIAINSLRETPADFPTTEKKDPPSS